jgi:hypothetical protein
MEMAKRSNALSGSGGKGGGPGSRALGQPTQYFVGQPSQKISPRGVSQFGSSIGNHVTDAGGKILKGGIEPVRVGTTPVGGPGGVPLGNTLTNNVGAGGPGTGRTVQHCGTQGQHGPVNPGKSTPARDILSGFGPDSAIVSERK